MPRCDWVGCSPVRGQGPWQAPLPWTHFEDEEAFGDVIATISLLQPVYMTLEKPTQHNNTCQEFYENGNTKVLLERNSLFIMSEDCRFKWRHGISKHKVVYQPTGNKDVEQTQNINNDNDINNIKFEAVHRKQNYRRVSLTIRHLLSGRKQVPNTVTNTSTNTNTSINTNTNTSINTNTSDSKSM